MKAVPIGATRSQSFSSFPVFFCFPFGEGAADGSFLPLASAAIRL
jgi:hypothetical protein